jgi:lipoprotein-releasing system permease protein
MFELTVALRYLIPRKKSLSTAIVSLLSVVVISLVVWLVLVFLSVTRGIERNWLQKLTSLHAPVRISPTERYYSSYYYQADSLSAASGYTLKTIGEKAEAAISDPYSDQTDAQAPMYWPSPERHSDGRLRDPVKETVALLNDMRATYQDYEIGGALLRLSLSRPTGTAGAGATLSQMSYLLSFMDRNPRFSSLVMEPSADDVDALLKMAADPKRLEAILSNARIDEVRVESLDPALLPENIEFSAFAQPRAFNEVKIPQGKNAPAPDGWQTGRLIRKGSTWTWRSPAGELMQNPQLSMIAPLSLRVAIAPQEYSDLASVRFQASGEIQDISLSGQTRWNAAAVSRAAPRVRFDAAPAILPPWLIEVKGQCRLPYFGSLQPFLLPKSYRDMGVRIGDRGTLNFAAHGAASAQEQRLNVQVAGFYDPGLFSMGGRCLIVPQSVTRTIHAASQTFSPDGTPTNGIFVWSDQDSETVKEKIEQSLNEAGLSSYWNVATFKDFEFSKELFQQFRSDRTLFLLIAILILLVACCNIISLLILLVNDKKREIAILQAMGASWRSVATIFGCCGLVMGALSSLIGTAAAIFTLNHLDSVVSFLSALQGHAAFQPAFFGQSLPNELSTEALLFVCIATPLLSLLAGLVPALRASRIRPAIALRQE